MEIGGDWRRLEEIGPLIEFYRGTVPQHLGSTHRGLEGWARVALPSTPPSLSEDLRRPQAGKSASMCSEDTAALGGGGARGSGDRFARRERARRSRVRITIEQQRTLDAPRPWAAQTHSLTHSLTLHSRPRHGTCMEISLFATHTLQPFSCSKLAASVWRSQRVLLQLVVLGCTSLTQASNIPRLGRRRRSSLGSRF